MQEPNALVRYPEPMLDLPFLKALTEAPAVGTACGPVVNLLTERFGPAWSRTLFPDAFCLFQKSSVAPEQLRAVLVAHMDEIGGVALGPGPLPSWFNTRVWGNDPAVFAAAELQAMDYLAQSGEEVFPVQSRLAGEEPDVRLHLSGDRVQPYRTVFTFREETVFEGNQVEGKALDPRATLYAVTEAVRRLDRADVGALLVMAEECAMEMAEKAVAFLMRRAPNLELVANADVPGSQNLGEGRLDLPAIRIFEGRYFVDPEFGIRMSERLRAAGVAHHLTGSRSGSQTRLFTPLAPTISVALPSEGIHLSRGRMSLEGIERCQRLLEGIAELGLARS